MSNKAKFAAGIVLDAGGQIIGRTKLQKVTYLLSVAGFEDHFRFEYRHYGPFSEELAAAAQFAGLMGYVEEVEKPASWGGTYSVYSSIGGAAAEGRRDNRVGLAEACARADAVELELAATAVFLALEGTEDPWLETQKRKPDKSAGGRLRKARGLYASLRQLPGTEKLPSI